MFKGDLTYDNTTAFKNDLNTTDVSDDVNKDGKVRIMCHFFFLLKTLCNLNFFSQSTNFIDAAKHGDLQRVKDFIDGGVMVDAKDKVS